jgi:spermidine synthase
MTEEILYEIESMGIPIQVIDKTDVRHLRFGNSIRQSSINKKSPFKLQTKYTRDMAKVFDHYRDIPETILVLGLGAGTIPSYLYHRFPKTKIYVVEILSELKEIASDYFSMPRDERLEIIIGDAYDYIMETQIQFDLIFMDVFSKNSIPKKFCTGEFYTGLKRLISADGYVAFNTWIDPSSYGNYIRKLQNVFDVVIEECVPKSGNHIAFCK